MTGSDLIRQKANELADMAKDFPDRRTKADLLHCAALLFRVVTEAIDDEVTDLVEPKA